MKKAIEQIEGAGTGVASGLRRGWEASWDTLWRRLFGQPDLGAVDFATLRRRTTPNDALVCPKGFCPAAAPDVEPSAYALKAPQLRDRIKEAALSEPGTSLLHSGPVQDRYLVRTRVMRYPDTVVAQVIGLAPDRATLALYSRSQIGRSDFGVNKRRLERWLARIAELTS